MAFKPIDCKRDQFRKYLESSGVIEVLSKSITKLMESPEKPDSPVEFIRENMGLSLKEQNKIDFLKEEVETYKKQVDDLKKEIESLKLERAQQKTALTNNNLVKNDNTNDVAVAPAAEAQNEKQTASADDKKTESEAQPAKNDEIDNNQNQKVDDATVDASKSVTAAAAAVPLDEPKTEAAAGGDAKIETKETVAAVETAAPAAGGETESDRKKEDADAVAKEADK